VSAGDKGFSLGKAAVGGVLTGGVGLLAGVHGSKRVRVNCLNCGFTWIPAEEAKKAKARKGLSKPVKIFLLFLIAMICVAVYLGKQDDRPAPQTPALPPPPAIVRTTIDDAIAKTGEYLNKAVVFEAPIDTILPAKDEDGNTMIVLAGAEAVAVCTEPGADKFAHLTKGDTVVVSAVHGGVLPTSQNGSIVLNKCVLNKK
jgi:tellurium resistance protein TerD